MIWYEFDNRVSCIDRQIAELEARRDALLSGTCYIGVHGMVENLYSDPYWIDEEEDNHERDSTEAEYHNT